MSDFSHIAYALSAHQPQQLPPDFGAEVAFAGRSNVGKSSAINAIANRRNLARTSKTPGRTQQIVFFTLTPTQRLVDLPGYGYAKVPRALRQHWGEFLFDYLNSRRCLKGLLLPMDIRHPLTELDQAMLNCCGEIALPVHILLTKADKLGRGAAARALHQVRAQLTAQPETTLQLFSAFTKQGVEEARRAVLARLEEN